MSKTNGTTEYQFRAPKEKQSFLLMIYNPQEGTYFGRTGKSWGQLFIFYAIFYIILAALFAICAQIWFSMIDEREPKWQLSESLIGTNPGLGFRPISEETERGSVIQYNEKKPEEGEYWISLMNQFMSEYNNTMGKKVKHCYFNTTRKAEDVCLVNIDELGDCAPKNSYGYKGRHPCVFLKLNRIYGWQPDCYDDPNNLPKDMPQELKDRINATAPSERKRIWISCNGHLGKDKEKFHNITYYPSTPGFPAYYYPYLNQPDYLSPLVAVKFEFLDESTLLDVECRAWAKNIIYSGSSRDRMGSVTFQMIVD